jgi:hypothetical protein
MGYSPTQEARPGMDPKGTLRCLGRGPEHHRADIEDAPRGAPDGDAKEARGGPGRGDRRAPQGCLRALLDLNFRQLVELGLDA